ncbi:hypothetical protein GCM10009118_22740 [Wandonia haliotis]|uniref:Pentapeptide repeat-containing protein n=1 Tax=Wandonia haliotis TaxID=574963 RepID=A0ABP3Y555_9FLAO
MIKEKDQSYIFECLEKQESIKDVTFEYAGFIDFENKRYKSIVFENCIFNDKVLFTNVNKLISFAFINCQFNEVFNVEDLKDITTIEFQDCKFKSIYINECSSYRLIIIGCEITKSLEVQDVKVAQAIIETSTNNLQGSISINSREIDDLYFRSNNDTYFESISLYSFNSIWIEADINNLYFNAETFKGIEWSSSLDHVYKVKNFDVSELKFSGNIVVQNTKIDNLNLSNVYSNSGILKFIETEIESITIDSCYIDNFILNQVQFTRYPDIQNSDLSNLKMINIRWADKSKSLENSFLNETIPFLYKLRKSFLPTEKKYDKVNISTLKYHIETYRQLKTASIKANNQIDRLSFYRNEMKLYWKLVRIEEDIPWNDRVLVFLNRWSSDFGQNWILPLIWLFLFHSIFFLFIMNCLWSNSFSGNFEFGQFWILLNPLHKTPDYINTGSELFIEFLMRIFNSYFIYHFVKATRKFGKP